MTGPHVTGPHVTGPHVTGPHVTGPHATGPHATGPHATGVHRIGAGRYQRVDGAILSEADLAECRPLHRDELRDLAWLLALLEDWLLHTGDDVRADLATFPGPGRHTIDDLIDHLGTQAVKLHQLTR